MSIDKKYEAAIAASEGWIDWHGGKCPVDIDAIVEVKYRNQNQYQYNNDRAGYFYWAHIGSSGDIIAYRVYQPTKSEQVRADAWRAYAGMTEKDEEDDLNECIGQVVDIPEWNGEGLPPVGVECEWLASGDHEWIAVTVLCYDGEDAWLKPSDGSRSFVVGNVDNFRPLRTEAERKRDAFINLLHGEYSPLGKNRLFRETAETIYDTIAAGKIPGVKLEEK